MKLNNLLSIKEFSIEGKLKLHNKVAKEVVNENATNENFSLWWNNNKDSETLWDEYREYKSDAKYNGEKPLTYRQWGKEKYYAIADDVDDTSYSEKKSEKEEIQYKGYTITKLFPSGYYEYRSEKEGKFLKFDTLKGAKKSIDKEKTKEKVNEGLNDTQELTFICDQLANSMEFYNSPEEFAEHIGSQGSMFDYDTLKQIAIDYWKLSPQVRLNNDTDDWSMWVLDNYETNESIKEAKEAKETKEQGVKSDEESGNLFGVAQVIDSKIPKVGSFSSYTKMINPPTPKERAILNAGQYIENDTVAGYINRIEGGKVFVESLEKPGEIIEVSIKDAVKVKKESKENTAKQKIKEYGSLHDDKGIPTVQKDK